MYLVGGDARVAVDVVLEEERLHLARLGLVLVDQVPGARVEPAAEELQELVEAQLLVLVDVDEGEEAEPVRWGVRVCVGGGGRSAWLMLRKKRRPSRSGVV